VDLLMLCGIFGNVSEQDIKATVSATPGLLRGHVAGSFGRHHDFCFEPALACSASPAERPQSATKQKPMGLAQLRSIAATMLSANASGRERNG
jgi:hypothetical protein